MTDTAVTIMWCGAILLVFCAFGAATEWLLRLRDERRAHRRIRRRIRKYKSVAPIVFDQNNVVELHKHSRRVDAA